MRRAILMMLLAACLTAMAIIGPAFAGPMEDAEAMLAGRDYGNAFSLFQQIAESGDPVAQFYLGFMYENGKGVGRDTNVAAKWYRRAADQGDDIAQYSVGRMYQAGSGVQQSYSEALKWYGMSAAQGNADAPYNIGLMYANGEGVPQDLVAARWWFQRAADQGAANALAALKVMNEKGLGISPDYKPPPLLDRRPAIQSGNETGSRSATVTADRPSPPIPWDIGPAGATRPPLQSDRPSAIPSGTDTGTTHSVPQNAAPLPAVTLGAVANAAWEGNPTVMAWRALQVALANTGEKLNANDLGTMIKESGVQDFTLPAGKFSREAAAMQIERERQKQIAADNDRRTDYSWTGTPVRALTRAAVKLGDPLYLAAVFLLLRWLRRSR